MPLPAAPSRHPAFHGDTNRDDTNACVPVDGRVRHLGFTRLLPLLNENAPNDASRLGRQSDGRVVMPEKQDFLSKAGDVMKLTSVIVLVLGLAQLGCYTWYYSVPFPFSLANLAIIGSLSVAIGLLVVTLLTVSVLFRIGTSAFEEVGDWFSGRDESTRSMIIAIVMLLILIGALLPVTTSYVLRHIGLGGGLKVVYYLEKDASVPADLLSAPNSQTTKPLFLVIDGGDMVYVRPDWKKRDGCLGIQKSQIKAVVQSTP